MSKPSKWQYGDSWEKYPIEPGQIWTDEKTGSSLAVHDIFNQLPDFMRLADVLYCDPPWNLGNVNSFATKNGSDKYLDDFSAFYNQLFYQIVKVQPSVCFIEIGKQHLSVFQEKMFELFPSVQAWQVTYYRKNISYLIRGGITPTNFDYTGMDDSQTPFLAIANDNPYCIADLCTGRGLTAISAFKQGKRFVGTELNKRRMAVTIDKLTALGAKFKIQ